MKCITVLILVFMVAFSVLAQETKSTEVKNANGKFKEVKINKTNRVEPEKKAVNKNELKSDKPASKIEIVTNDAIKSAKPKEIPRMGSAEDSGPPVQIKKIDAQHTATTDDLKKVLGDPVPVNKREK